MGAVLLAAAAGALAAEPELGGNCAMSASLGSKLPTTCSVVWISPQDKLYCFGNEMAKQAFLKDPAGNELRATTFWKDPSLWEKLKKERPEG
jgi:hypothetical protein